MAGSSANVRTIDALHQARAALADFRVAVRSALSEAVSGADRVQHALDGDLPMVWKQAIRKAEVQINHAKSELAKAEMQAMGSAMSVREQKKLVERAIARRAEAEARLETTKKWARQWERENTQFKGRLQTLARIVESDVPREEAKLALQFDRLMAYLKERPDGPGDGREDRTAAGTEPAGTGETCEIMPDPAREEDQP